MERWTLKENHIGSAVSEILWYLQTDRIHILLLLYRYTLTKHIFSPNNKRSDIQTDEQQEYIIKSIYYYLDVAPDFNVL